MCVRRGLCPSHLSAALPICPCREGVEKVLGSLTLSSEELAYGRTKIFIRSPKTVSQEVCCPTWWGGMWNSPEKEEDWMVPEEGATLGTECWTFCSKLGAHCGA